MLAGFLKPSAGEVSVLGQATWRNPDLYRRLGLVPEREAVYGSLTGYEFVLLNARLQGLPDAAEAARRAIREVDLEEAAQRSTEGYSKGMKQRIKVAAALVHDPAVLLLDEPFNGADPRQRLHLMGLFRRLAEEGRTIVFSSHILEEVERLAERVLVIVGGRLAASGDFREIRRLMTDRPHTFTLRTTDDRRLAAALVAHESVLGVELSDGRLTVRTSQLGAFARAVPVVARSCGVSLRELRPTDESLEDVFSYLVTR
jgi:ABC-2 type transport system ATP-binding protein